MNGTLRKERISLLRRAVRIRRIQERTRDYALQYGHGISQISRCRVCERGRSDFDGNERVLQAAWKRQLPGSEVIGRDGTSYTVIYPGRPADGSGPDFRDAVMRGPNGQILRGDVEIHIRNSGWRAHRHHLDPRYNGVAFHVTGEPQGPLSGNGLSASTVSRRPLHLLVLSGSEKADPDLEQVPNVLPGVLSDGLTPEVLSEAGDQRFLSKSSGLSIMLRAQGGDQAVWSAVLDCLGDSRNRRGFRRVSSRLPWEALVRGMRAGVGASEALMWAGGFGPKPNDLLTGPSVRDAPDWTPGGRPDNRPERRLMAAAVLAERWNNDGPLNSVIDLVRNSSGPGELIDAFRVDEPRTNSVRSRALLGTGRAREITVNAILPLIHGWSLMVDRWDVSEKALILYRHHPKLPMNTVTREMVSLLKPGHGTLKIRSAREQQGLILMYRAMTAGPVYALPQTSDN
ncbi:MAG: DUF2851 family protein [Chloroflexi bacterium]|nr:DUF2851 family protein [Chloroflexota bacterium]